MKLLLKKQKSNRFKIYILNLIIFITLSSIKAKENILSHKQMVDIIVDLELAKSLSLYQTISTEESMVTYKNNILLIYKEHSISSETFIESYNFYINSPTELLNIYNDVVDQLESLL